MNVDEIESRTTAERILAALSANARETLAQVAHEARETELDLARVAEGRGAAVAAECLGGAEGRARDGWLEYLAAIGAQEPRYVDVIDRAREIAADVVSSLPRGDDASVAEQVAAQAPGLDVVAAELGYDADGFRALVEREVARLQAPNG